ncbi:LytTR family DNA-binding domain-containing protein [Methylocaldum sp.]|uniref:LytR/AlgR family response regulator transcription factor n=1 Tax=Methylocaldum sp. TaxID=1969727 RepID=UPI002D73EC24|nr:LytTR family DNA-binding domain-containing protein [Methylocaldum sp.]HYE35276.1 LytTR family DNA-binding domain-containing protein [Methylocaldum sp.]
MKILIVDDEAPARNRLRDLLGEIDSTLTVVGEAADGEQALRLAAQTQPDAVLLDIRMPRIDGIAAARELARLEQPPAVVFTTAYNEYALEAFEVSAVDYLLKPVRKDRLAGALQKAERFTEATWKKLEAALPAGQSTRSHLCIHSHGELRLIPIDTVLYFRAEQKYTTVRTPAGEMLIDDPLKSLEEEFGESFIRVHRNALVAIEHVVALKKLSLGGMALRLRGIPETLEISRRHLSAVRAQFKQLAMIGEGD